MNQKQFTAEVLNAEKSMYHIARSILQNDEDCSDAMQNAILHAFEKLHTLRREDYFKTWLTRILINECYQIVRSRRQQVPYEEYMAEHVDTGGEAEYSEVFEAVMGLEDNYRVPVVLFYVEGYSVREIGQILGISQGAVKTRLCRGRSLLKAELMGGYEDAK